MTYHEPVLLHHSINGLNINPDGTYVDVTYGGGGHSRLILSKLNKGRLFAFDQDEDALQNQIDDERFTLLHQNFAYMKNFLTFYNAVPVDGILADLGVSSYQLDAEERGFSFRADATLDLRMDRNTHRDAKTIINSYTEEELKNIFKLYGEIKNAGQLAKLIVQSRKEKEIETTFQLVGAIDKAVFKKKENQYLAKVFQALRIEVNDEMNALEAFLEQAKEILKPGGRLVVISYHSLEDRLVKNIFKSGNLEGKIEKDFYGNPLVPFKQITRKPIVPENKEIEENNRARSAKLRIVEKI
jgi:16S rRNA (cytosine1402-N4)-methyltransferase